MDGSLPSPLLSLSFPTLPNPPSSQKSKDYLGPPSLPPGGGCVPSPPPPQDQQSLAASVLRFKGFRAWDAAVALLAFCERLVQSKVLDI